MQRHHTPNITSWNQMAESIIQKAWQHYRQRKSKLGIVTDFLFLVFAIVVLTPPLRFGVGVILSRLALTQPKAYEQTEYLPNEGLQLHTANGLDTIIMTNLLRPAVYNFGSTWSAQSCAELRSLNKFAQRYANRIDVFFITDEEPSDVERYFNKKGYTIRPLFYNKETIENSPEMMHDILIAVPATFMVNANGRIVVKSVGAAQWTGNRIESIAEKL